MDLYSITVSLQKYLYKLQHRFETSQPPETMNDRAFFNDMKEETKPIYDLLKTWEIDTLKYIDTNKSNLFPQQIIATIDNIEMIILHSYYIDIRRRFYMEYFNSTIYILEQLLRELGDNNYGKTTD